MRLLVYVTVTSTAASLAEGVQPPRCRRLLPARPVLLVCRATPHPRHSAEILISARAQPLCATETHGHPPYIQPREHAWSTGTTLLRFTTDRYRELFSRVCCGHCPSASPSLASFGAIWSLNQSNPLPASTWGLIKSQRKAWPGTQPTGYRLHFPSAATCPPSLFALLCVH